MSSNGIIEPIFLPSHIPGDSDIFIANLHKLEYQPIISDIQMKKETRQFWKIKPLDQMSDEEWELLCDNCGKCCLEKTEDPQTGKIEVIPIACRFLDTYNCTCILYEERFSIEPDCLKITPANISEFKWLPRSCAYRRLSEGHGLEWWHRLVSGDPDSVHSAGISVRGRVSPYGCVRPGYDLWEDSE